MSGVRTIGVAEDEDGLRLDRWFKRHFPELPHGHLEKLLRAGQIRIDGKRAKANARLEAGQAVRVPPLGARSSAPPRPAPAPEIGEATRAELEARVLYRDDWL
ncbi:MAG: RluA family pseudouridine synthase, partial [Kiloniellales bacterium]